MWMLLDTGRISFPTADKPAVSKSKTKQQFINRYSGPEYMVHYRYALLMVIIFTCMMYGIGLPLLFPIATINLCIMYAVDR